MKFSIKQFLGISSLTLLGGILFLTGTTAHAKTTATQAAIAKTTPTLYFHGSSSSYKAEKHMVAAAKKAKVTNAKSVIRANVSAHGKVTLIGKWHADVKNPIVEVNYLNSNNFNYHTDGRWARNVIKHLQKVYHMTKFNAVGHSMGNMAIMYYLLDNARNRKLPQLQKQVSLGGHYDGVLGEGDWPHRIKLSKDNRPSPMDSSFKQLTKLRSRYPDKQVSVLNIYGDLQNGTNSDGRVSTASSRSLYYLIGRRAKHYQSKRIKGAQGQHSRLHNNAQVDRLMIKFLWS